MTFDTNEAFKWLSFVWGDYDAKTRTFVRSRVFKGAALYAWSRFWWIFMVSQHLFVDFLDFLVKCFPKFVKLLIDLRFRSLCCARSVSRASIWRFRILSVRLRVSRPDSKFEDQELLGKKNRILTLVAFSLAVLRSRASLTGMIA